MYKSQIKSNHYSVLSVKLSKDNNNMNIQIDKILLQNHSNEKTLTEWAKFFNCGKETISRWCKKLGVSYKPTPARKISAEEKQKLSIARKKFLKENPDKHPWRSKDKFKSEPCENVKKFLKKLNINFIEEFPPEIAGRFFSIDIALPDKKIALEINGNQHYEKDGKLKHYYQERHNLLSENGWNVFEIHYSACFNLDKWTQFIETIKNSPRIECFDYFNYTPKENKKCVVYKTNQCPDCRGRKNNNNETCYKCFLRKKHQKRSENKFNKWNNCPFCDSVKNYKAIMCSKCRTQKRRENFPSKDELKELFLKLPMTKIGKHYNVSDNTAKKWCKFYKLL